MAEGYYQTIEGAMGSKKSSQIGQNKMEHEPFHGEKLREERAKKSAKSHDLKNKKKNVAGKMDAGISKIYDDMEKRHKKKMEEINASDRPDWEKKHMRRANSSGIARFLMND